MWFWESLTLGFLLLLPVFKRRQRKKLIRLGLPDAVDLTAICIQAGLSPYESVARVSQELHYAHPDLSDELYLVKRDMRAGYSWDEALCNLSDRTDVGEIRVLAKALVRGGPLEVVRVLRTFSNSFRTVQEVRRQLFKVAFKLVPALLLFVVPSVLIVTIGPAFIQLIRTFKPLGH